MSDRLALLNAYLRTRLLSATLRDRAAIDRWQVKRIESLRRHAVRNVGFYRRFGDVPFSQFPIIGKADVMSRYEAFNILGLTAEEAWRRLDENDPLPGYDIGCSTGTSGNRGLYVVSDRERFLWLGTIVAKAIADLLRRRHRVAIILPRASRLYDSANESRLLKLQFNELNQGLPKVAENLERFQPTVVVGPPRALRWMAEHNVAIAPRRMFSAAEVLDGPDRTAIEQRYSLRLGQIYMATEGLFGVSCRHGTLHLAEDAVHFELEPVGDGLASPIVTDFTRRMQVMARYRMNDLLRVSKKPCPCGSPLLSVDEVVGRRDDCFDLPSPTSGARVTITPDVLRNAIVGADRRIDDFRLRQTGPRTLQLVLPLDAPVHVQDAARLALSDAIARLGADAEIAVEAQELTADTTAKLRRVEQRWKPDRQ